MSFKISPDTIKVVCLIHMLTLHFEILKCFDLLWHFVQDNIKFHYAVYIAKWYLYWMSQISDNTFMIFKMTERETINFEKK